MKKLLIPFFALLLIGAGCGTIYDEEGCPLNNYGPSYIQECHEKVRCLENGGFPAYRWDGGYAGCSLPNSD